MENFRSKSAAEWRERIRQWQASGLTGYSWCKENNLPYKTFGYWKRRFLGVSKPTSKFFELPAEREDNSKLSIEGNGISLNVAQNFDEESLLQILRILRRG